MASETPFAQWLRTEMPKHGYPLEGPRAGGITRLADDAGVSRAAMSRIVAGQGEPSVDSLRGIGKVLGYSLPEMMVIAGVVKPEEMPEPATRVSPVALETPTATPPQHLGEAIARLRQAIEAEAGNLPDAELQEYWRQIREMEEILFAVRWQQKDEDEHPHPQEPHRRTGT